jgi:alpha-mannosidase
MKNSDVEMRHSTPEAYLSRVKHSGYQAPVFDGEIQRVFAGSYTSVAPIKRRMRQVEAAMYSAECWASIAWWRYGIEYPAEDLRNAWKRIMLNAFHDVITGALIENALPGVNDMFGFASDVARRIIVSRQHTMLPNVASTPDAIPLYVLNPHAQTMKAHISGNFLRSYANPISRGTFRLLDDEGRHVVHQESGGSPVLEGSDMQPFIGFVADVPPMMAKRYEIRFDDFQISTAHSPTIVEDGNGIAVENRWWKAIFNRAKGGLAQLHDRNSGRDVLNSHICLKAMADTGHAWGGMERAVFSQTVGEFKPLTSAQLGALVGEEVNRSGQAVRVIHCGPVSVTVECVTMWRLSQARIRYTLYAELPQLDIDVRLYMQARQKMIKLAMPFALSGVKVTCETPFGSAKRTADSTEHHYGRWLRLDSDQLSIGLANNGQYAFHVSEHGTLGLSLTRGAVYSAWDDQLPLDPNKSYSFMDQETLDTRFRMIAGTEVDDITDRLIPLGLELNHPLEFFFVYHPPTPPDGAPAQPLPFLQVEPATVVLSALKKADTEDALIVRLYEAAGKAVEARIILEGSEPKTVMFKPHEIKTWHIMNKRDGMMWTACNLMEEAGKAENSSSTAL